MAKMTKRLRSHLEGILADLDRGLSYIDRDNVRIAVKVKPEHALAHHFTRAAD